MGSVRERKTSSGKIIFDAAVRCRGGRFSYRTFARRTDAKLWVQETEINVRKGQFINQHESETPGAVMRR